MLVGTRNVLARMLTKHQNEYGSYKAKDEE